MALCSKKQGIYAHSPHVHSHEIDAAATYESKGHSIVMSDDRRDFHGYRLDRGKATPNVPSGVAAKSRGCHRFPRN
jgi:hypothetical protein